MHFIREVCRARCCYSSVTKTGIFVAIHKNEKKNIEQYEVKIKGGLLQPKLETKCCPFLIPNFYKCSLHRSSDKPFGCIVSPFTINKNNTLIIRNRYKLFVCYKTNEKKIPAYNAFSDSLIKLFGRVGYKIIQTKLRKKNSEDFYIPMPISIYNKVMERPDIKNEK